MGFGASRTCRSAANERIGDASVSRRCSHNNNSAFGQLPLCGLPCVRSKIVVSRRWLYGRFDAAADVIILYRSGRRVGGRRRRFVCRTRNQTQKQYIFQAIMLCANEILLRIYVIITCIKQISILLDMEATFGFHLGTTDAVRFVPLPYCGSSYRRVTTTTTDGTNESRKSKYLTVNIKY